MSKKAEKKPMAKIETKDKTVTISDGVLNLKERVAVEATGTAPFHKKGEAVMCSPFVAAKMKANGWCK